MEKIILSNEAYNEFKGFLDENKVEDYKIRINLTGVSCHGPSFNITLGEKEADDLVEQINDITFFIKPNVYNEFGALTILSNGENEGRGLNLRPLVEQSGGCSGCSGCH